MQADTYYNFNSDDLIMVSWTNFAREDRYVKQEWVTPGNIYTQNIYSEEYVKKWSDDTGYAIRDLAMIKAAWELLDKRQCQFHFMKIIDFYFANQWESFSLFKMEKSNLNENYSKLENFYEFYLSNVEKSFTEIIWNNDFDKKFISDKKRIHENFHDGHPFPDEHLKYLENIFDHQYLEKTKLKVLEITKNLDNDLRQEYELDPNFHHFQLDYNKYFFIKALEKFEL